MHISSKIKTYRPGATGALLDIYEQAIFDLKQTVKAIADSALPIIIDSQTTDENCRSIQTVLTHVVHAGYGYATSIYNSRGHNTNRPGKTVHATIQAYVADLTGVFTFTETVLKSITDDELEQLRESLKIKSGWGHYTILSN